MKKITVYLVMLFAFFIGATDLLAVDIYNAGVVSGFDLNSGNTYTCGSDKKSVLKLLDEDNINYYTTACGTNFPCNYETQSENTCVNQNRYLYTETGNCYITCDNLSDNPSSNTEIGSYQHTIWNNLSKYQKTSCDVDRINTTNLQNAMDTLINNNTCSANSSFYILQEYKHNEGESKVVAVKTVQEMCAPQVKIKKECIGFSKGTFKVKVGNEEISLSCGETSEAIDVASNTPIVIEELNSDGYMVYYSDNLVNGTVTVNSGTQIVTITNAVGSAELVKTNAVSGAPMKGILFTLEKQVNGEWVKATDYNGDYIGNMETNADGKLSFSGLLVGKYRVVEVSDANGNYIAADPEPFEINKNEVDSNFTQNLELTNDPFNFKLLKVDSNGVGLSDSIFMIEKKGADGVFRTVSEPIIDKNGTSLYLEKNGYYIITEIQAPTGYDILGNSIEIDITNGNVTIVEGDLNYVSIDKKTNETILKVINDKSKVKIYKRDSATGNLVSGAKLELKNADGTVIEEFITSDSSFAISLIPGRYIINEIEAPKNYEKIKESFEFIVKEDGTIEAVTNNVLFEINGMNINIYNVKPTTVPDTGIGLNILLTIVGISLVGGGSYIVYKKVKKSKNVK